MEIINRAVAIAIAESCKDGNDKPVDKGVLTSVAIGIQIARLFGMDTSSSCEGHIDWGSPYPVIGFDTHYHSPQIETPLWKVWKRQQRKREEYTVGKSFLEKKFEISSVIRLLTNSIIDYYENSLDLAQSTSCMFFLERRGPLSFAILPVHQEYFQGLYVQGNFQTLDEKLVTLRAELENLLEYILSRVSKLSSLEGTLLKMDVHTVWVLCKVYGVSKNRAHCKWSRFSF